MELGDVETLFKSPHHPYTQALMNSFPDIKSDKKTLTGLPGSPPDLINPPSGCKFHPRCQKSEGVCHTDEPAMEEIGPNHFVACHKAA
jgi:peptide/nickel transport system ATP-binding protein